MTTLKKRISTTYDPGSPGVAASPGRAARAAYTVAVVSYVTYPTGYWVQSDSKSVGASSYAFFQTGTKTVQVTTYVTYPATEAVAPTAGVAATPAQFVSDYNIGWNAGARSVGSIAADGRLEFKPSASARGIVVGLDKTDSGTTVAEIDFGLYVTEGKFKVIEKGIDKTSYAGFASGDVLSVQRRGTAISYYRNEALVYASETASTGELIADCSLYYGGDTIVDADFSTAVIYGDVYAEMELEAAAVYASGSASETQAGPETSGAEFVLQCITAKASDKSYASSLASLEGVETVAHGAIMRSEFAETIEELTSSGFGHIAVGAVVSMEAATALGSDKTYASSTASLRFLTAEASASGLDPTYALANPATAYLTTAGIGLTGEIGGAGVMLKNLKSLAADHPYGEGVVSLYEMNAEAGETIEVDGTCGAAMGAYALHATGKALDANAFDGELAYSFTGRFGASAKLEGTAFSLTTTGTTTIVGRAKLGSPGFTLTASGMSGAIGKATLTLSEKLAVTGYAGAVLAVAVGGYSMAASGLHGSIGKAGMTLPLYELIAEGNTQATGRAELMMPALRPVPSGLAYMATPGYRLLAVGAAEVTVDYTSYCVNLAGNQVTRYTNFPFFKVIRHNGSYFGVASDGLYLLDGAMDDTEPIRWNVMTGFDDLGSGRKKRLNGAFFHGRFERDAVAAATDEQGTSRMGGMADGPDRRVKFGKGVRSRRIAFGLSGTGAMEVDSVDLDIDILERAI